MTRASTVELDIRPPVREALANGRPVLALESTLIAHGLPWPSNLEIAREVEAVARAEGVIPATIAVWQGRPTVGLTDVELEQLAHCPEVGKASRRDLAGAIVQGASAATTVSATLALAHRAGLRVFATGGIGGVHPPRNPGEASHDVSADLEELARTPVAVVCAGAKSILDLPATLERLESLGVPVVGMGVDTLPAFYVRDSGLPVSVRVDNEVEAAQLIVYHWQLGGAGVVLAQPVPVAEALEPALFHQVREQAERLAHEQGVTGPALTPFLLARLAELTGGQSLRANRALLLANARLGARLAQQLCQLP
jgi:pseudouridine-5'-phosphate glycosidase